MDPYIGHQGVIGAPQMNNQQTLQFQLIHYINNSQLDSISELLLSEHIEKEFIIKNYGFILRMVDDQMKRRWVCGIMEKLCAKYVECKYR